MSMRMRERESKKNIEFSILYNSIRCSVQRQQTEEKKNVNIEILTTPSSCLPLLLLLSGKQASSAQPCIGMAFMETNELLIRFFFTRSC